jgi:hypothetical protein
MQTDTPLLTEKSEVSLAKHMAFGALAGMVGWGVVTLVVARLGWPDESWGFTLTLCAFAGLWVGPFFGTAAGVAMHQLKADAAEKAAHASDAVTPMAPASSGAMAKPLAPAH